MSPNFVTYLKTNNYSPETIFNYQHDMEVFFQFCKKDFSKVTKTDIEDYKTYLSTTHKLSPASLNRYLSSLRGYIKFLNYSDIPTPLQVQMVKTETKVYQVPELTQLVKLIESPSKLEKDKVVAARNRAMLEILFSTGVRISELLSLNKDDITKSGKVIIMGKGKKERVVYLTERALIYLNNYLDLRSDSLPALFIPQKGTRSTTLNSRISTNYLQERIKHYREALGITIKTSAHSLRHGFATYLSENGASSVAIQMLLGHASPNTTARYINASQKFAEDNHKEFHPLNI